ncbi:NAD(P)H-hydrate dehydratase [Halocalculus aciditolerans]
MAAVDRNAAALGVSTKQLMESSGSAVARAVRRHADPGASVAVVAGRGNNGGDAFVAARFLDDYAVSTFLLGRRESITTDISRSNWDALGEAELPRETVTDSAQVALGDPDVVIDGVLGTGVTGAPREPERTAIEAMNATDATVVSVDVPSGTDADTGEAADVAVEADEIVTFHRPKPGLLGRDDVTVADIGIPSPAETFVGPGDLQAVTRDPQAHKGDFGRVFVVGGGPYTGAPALAAQAALRAGADLAYVAAPDRVADRVQGYSEDLIVESYDGEVLTADHVPALLDRAGERDVVVLGPGLGSADATLDAVHGFLADYEGRAVVDADALQVVPDVDTEATLVCTPHQGELVKMGGPRSDDWRERRETVENFARDLGHTVLVKGAYDVVTDGETTRVNRTGNPGMTVGGTGDVLAGATGARLAVHDPVEAGALAAYANGKAGDAVVDEQGYGLLASDLLDELPRAFKHDDD